MSNLATKTRELVKTLKINEDTHERLKKYGKFGESFDDLLNRLMDIADGRLGSAKR